MSALAPQSDAGVVEFAAAAGANRVSGKDGSKFVLIGAVRAKDYGAAWSSNK
ncbi:hypothetical protein [Alishewanella longhuensis]